MNLLFPALATVGVIGLVLSSGPGRGLRAGHTYHASFETPDGARSVQEAFLQGLKAIAPPGAIVQEVNAETFSFTFVAPRTSKLTDLQTPFGTAKLIKLTELE